MTYNTQLFSSNQTAVSRSLIQTYLAELPILDQQVLYLRYSEKKEPAVIAREMEISKAHAERILARARNFGAGAATAPPRVAPPPVWSRSPIAN
jgi:DNA-directed RNA polymerase specialized sigma subunit